MRPTRAQPTGVERSFDADEIIVSKTDPKGIIRYANDVFLRVSAYDEVDLLGRPHSIVRHPDMPRCVFKLLWDTISGGDEIFAYIVNLAGDGAHYWVLAHVTPSFGPGGRIVGYHSNRRAPDRAAVREVGELYAQLRAEERRRASSPDGLAASTRLLTQALEERGQSYDEFVWSLTADAVGV